MEFSACVILGIALVWFVVHEFRTSFGFYRWGQEVSKQLGVILATEQELSDKLDTISTTVASVAADVADLKTLLEAAEGIPQEIMDKANAIADSLSAIDAQHPA